MRSFGAQEGSFWAKGVRLAYLFGSYAKGREVPMIGLDVVVATYGPGSKAELKAAIAEEIGIPSGRIPLLDLGAASPVMKVKILKRGIRIFGDSSEVRPILSTAPPNVIEALELERDEFYA